MFSLGLYKDVSVGEVQHCVADELLSHGNGFIHGHTQIGQVIQKPERTPHIKSHLKSVNLSIHLYVYAIYIYLYSILI